MAHPEGERLRCDECGAEIMYTRACPCPETEQKEHADICCGKQMQSLGVQSQERPAPAAP